MNIDKLKTYLLATATKALQEYAQLKGLPDTGSISYGHRFDHAEDANRAPLPYIHIDRPKILPRAVNSLYTVQLGFFDKSEVNMSANEMDPIYSNMIDLANIFIRLFNADIDGTDATIVSSYDYYRHAYAAVVSGVAFEFTFEGVNEIC